MKQAPKIWEYADYAHQPARIEYNGEKLLSYTKFNKDTPRYYTPQEFLCYPYCLTNHFKENTIAKYLINNHAFDLSKMSEKENKHWRFWKYLDLSKLPNLIFHPTPKYNFQTFLEISSEGLRTGYYKFVSQENPQEKFYNENKRLDTLFFHGPTIPGLLLEDRKRIREIFIEALGNESGFSLKDAFPLFDYSKIPTEKWEYSNDGGFSGECLELYPDRVYFGGWSNPRDGGGSDSSIEEVWNLRTHKNSDNFKAAYEKIYQILENVII